MAWHRIHHVRSRVRELDESKTKYLNQARSRMIAGGNVAQNGANVANVQQQQGGGGVPQQGAPQQAQQQPNGSGTQPSNS